MIRNYLFILIFFAYSAGCALAANSISINEVWIAEAPPVSGVNAGYLQIINSGEQPLTLLEVTSPVFSKIEIHETVMRDNIAKMQYLQTVEIPAGETLVFAPGGLHLMMFNAKQPLTSGDSVPVSLRFSDGIVRDIQAIVRQRDGMTPDHSHH